MMKGMKKQCHDQNIADSTTFKKTMPELKNYENLESKFERAKHLDKCRKVINSFCSLL
jgi:hypothetical protein